MRVIHLSPTYFSPESIIGGGERFAEELARAMAQRVNVKFVSFGRELQRQQLSPSYERVILHNWTGSLITPFSPLLPRELLGADVVHCHQYFVLPTFIACLFSAITRTPVFVSDLGGGGWTPGYQIDQSRWVAAHLPISQYAARSLHGRNKRHRVIYGGVDLQRFAMRSQVTHDGSVVFLGRILPHKGIHDLIAGLPRGMTLHIIGSEVDGTYRKVLGDAIGGKLVHFHTGCRDDEVVRFLQRAMVLVHPTPVNPSGDAGANELFGLALVEAMACGCPVIASRAASLPEIVEHEVSGLLVPPNDPGSIRQSLERLASDEALWMSMCTAARQRAEDNFRWEHVVSRCLAAYAEGRQAERDSSALAMPVRQEAENDDTR